MSDQPGRALGVAALLRMGYSPADVAAALSRADKGDVSGALDVLLPRSPRDDTPTPSEERK